MTRSQEERLDELADQITQIKSSLQDLAGSFVDAGGDDNPDDSGDVVDTLDTMLAQIEDLESSLDDLRETLQG